MEITEDDNVSLMKQILKPARKNKKLIDKKSNQTLDNSNVSLTRMIISVGSGKNKNKND